jgi:flagellar secretion chaperone FliS
MKPAGSQSYLKTKIMTASPAELRLMLLEGAIRFAEQARHGLEQKDYEACYVGVTKTQSILLELINSLRPEHDRALCEKLSSLYTFMYTQLIRASSEKNLAIFDEVIGLLRYECETWALLLDQLTRENGGTPPQRASDQLSVRV